MKEVKDMSFEEIKEWADTEHAKFWELYQYLNDFGKETFEAFSAVDKSCTFASDKEELAELIQEDIDNGRITNKHVIFKLNHFIKEIKK